MFIRLLIVLAFFPYFALASEESSLFVTVITADDIKSMGATNLDEALKSVPGLHLSVNYYGNPLYIMRGIYSTFNPEVQVLVNGVEITNVYLGHRAMSWGGIPAELISRIEVTRTADSANFNSTTAFAGAINVITKTKQDINEPEMGMRIGSFNTRDIWALGDGSWQGFDVVAFVSHHDTDGSKQIIEADHQTLLDSIFGTHASLAPGPVSLERQTTEARLDVTRDLWQLRLGLQLWDNMGYYAGTAQALDPILRHASERFNMDLTYDNPQFSKYWELQTQFVFQDNDWTVEPGLGKRIFPPGANLGEGVYPEGMRGDPEMWERHSRFNVSGLYKQFAPHSVRIKAGFNYADLYRTKEKKNFGPDPITGEPLPPDSPMVEVTDTPLVYMREGDRRIYYFFLQDHWEINHDWKLDAGVRYDKYSDFGKTINPQFTLTWLTLPNFTTGLNYARSFRAPSFAELWNTNAPTVLGNPDLEPETIQFLTLVFDYQPTETLQLGFNAFYYRWDDIIQLVPDLNELATHTMQNTGRQIGKGIEWEVDWKLAHHLHLLGNYAFQYSFDEANDVEAGNVPHHQVYLRASWNFLPNWYLTPQIKWVSKKYRQLGDHRPAIDGYNIVDLTLRGNVQKNWEVALSARNLFDSDAREPSPPSEPSAFIPFDLPLTGRSYFLELRYHFQ